MTMKIHKPRLRNALRKLRRIPFDRSDPANVAMAPQEMLDFLAMFAGLKPVCLVGRGFDDPDWVVGVERVAEDMRLHVVYGAKWYAEPEHAGLPDWYAEVEAPNSDDAPVVYICRQRTVAEAVRAVSKTGEITVEKEAGLLGYPECCVRDDYRRTRTFNEGFSLMLHRTAGGDEDEMRRIIREDVPMTAETEEERSMLSEATELRFVPFTSIQMCAACAADPDSAAMQVSRRYEALACAVDTNLTAEISRVEVMRNVSDP